MTEIIFADSNNPLTCEDFNQTITALTERSNHTGQQDCSTIFNLEACILNLNIWIETINRILALENQYNELYTNLYGNGELASLINDLNTQINNLINNLEVEISGLQIFQDVQNIAVNNQTNVTSLINSLNILDDSVLANQNRSVDNKNKIYVLETSVNEIIDNTIPDLESNLTNRIEKYPEPNTLTTNSLNQSLINTPTGLIWQTSTIIINKSFEIPGDFNTIQEALNFLNYKIIENVTLNVKTGNFIENLNINYITTLVKGLIIKGKGTGITNLVGNINLNCSASIQIEDLTVVNPITPLVTAISLNNKSNCLLNNINISNFTNGIFATNNSRIESLDLNINQCIETGIKLENNSKSLLKSSTITNCYIGLQAHATASFNGQSVTVKNCTVGVNLEPGSNGAFKGVLVESCSKQGLNISGSLYAKNCTSKLNLENGIAVYDGGVAWLDNTFCIDNQNHGIVAVGKANVNATATTSRSNGFSGFSAELNSYIAANGCSASFNNHYGFNVYMNSTVLAQNTSSNTNNNNTADYSESVSGQSNSNNGIIIYS